MSKKEHDTVAAQFREEISTLNKPWFRSCSAFLQEHGIYGGKCLDLCAGNGEFADILRKHHNMEVTCADYIPEHLHQVAQLGFPTIEIDLDSEGKTIDEIGTTYQNQFDMVFSLATIEHVFNSDNLLRFAHMVLKPDGLLVVNTPNISFLGYRLYSLLGGNRPFGEGHHIRFWDYRFLRINLYLNGFSILHDRRGFFTLPEDTLARALRGHFFAAKLLALCFAPFHVLQRFSFLRGFCCDELTVVCAKDSTIPFGFDYLKVKTLLNGDITQDKKQLILARLGNAKDRGWLNEHPFMRGLAETASIKATE